METCFEHRLANKERRYLAELKENFANQYLANIDPDFLMELTIDAGYSDDDHIEAVMDAKSLCKQINEYPSKYNWWEEYSFEIQEIMETFELELDNFEITIEDVEQQEEKVKKLDEAEEMVSKFIQAIENKGIEILGVDSALTVLSVYLTFETKYFDHVLDLIGADAIDLEVNNLDTVNVFQVRISDHLRPRDHGIELINLDINHLPQL